MKTKLYTLIFFMLCSFIKIQAQSTPETVRKSKTVQSEITFIVKKTGALEYIIDKNSTEHKADTVEYFKVKNRKFRMYVKFINPLKFQINTSNKELDDELYKASQEYLSNVLDFLVQVKGIDKNLEGTKGKNGIKMIQMVDSLRLEPKFAEMYLLIRANNKNYFNLKESREFMFLKLLDTLNFSEAKASVLEKYNQLFDNLYAIEKSKSISTVIDKNAIISELIDKELENLNERMSSIKQMTKSFKKNVIESYMKSVVTEAANDIEAFEKEAEGLKIKYNKIEKLFNDMTFSDFYPPGSNEDRKNGRYELKPTLDLKKSKRYELTVSVEKIKFNSDEKTMTIEATEAYVLHVRRFQLFTPVVSSGVLYTDLTFKQYGTDTNANGNTIITESKDKVSNLSIAAYLNMYVENKWNLPIYLQLGFGTSTERPLFFLGGGFTLSDKLNISAGGIFTWFPKLNDLVVGQEVTGTSAIQEDITYDFVTKPKFYIGINFDIGKK